MMNFLNAFIILLHVLQKGVEGDKLIAETMLNPFAKRICMKFLISRIGFEGVEIKLDRIGCAAVIEFR